MIKFPLVSIIIPVYNVERYLDQCIESVVNQDIDFSKNIELILVDDGSTDESGMVCEKYAKKYPDNVVIITQENAGASHARNTGLKAAQGEFVGFIDADDYISKDAIGAVMDFFKTAPDDTHAAIIRVVQFGDKNRERPINRKFDLGTRVADLSQPEWFDICPRVAPSFIRTSIAKKHYFHEEIRFYEDTRYLNEVTANTMKLGIVAKGTYFNRKHDGKNREASITTGATGEKRFYLDSPEKVSLYLLQKMAGRRKYPPLYFQYLALYEMRWRIFYNSDKPRAVLSRAEYRHYVEVNKKILCLISDEAIIGFKLNNVWQRVYLLNLKHDTDVLKRVRFNEKNKLVWHKHVLFNHMKKMQTRLTDFYVVNNNLVLEGYFAEFVVKGVKVYPRVDGAPYNKMVLLPDSLYPSDTPLEYDVYKRTAFMVRVPLGGHREQYIDFACEIKGKVYTVKRLNIYPMYDVDCTPPRYSKVGGYVIVWRREGLSIFPDTPPHRLGFELGRVRRYLIRLYRRIVK